MKFSKLFCGLAVFGGVAVSFTAGLYVGKNPLQSGEVVKPEKVKNPGEAPMDTVLQDGKPVSLSGLMNIYRKNPNRFKAITEKSKFRVEGEILSVSEASSWDEIAGFHIPLTFSNDDVARTVAEIRGEKAFPMPVSLYVRGLESAQIAAFNPGQSIKADCKRIRVVTDGFVFDDCKIPKEASK